MVLRDVAEHRTTDQKSINVLFCIALTTFDQQEVTRRYKYIISNEEQVYYNTGEVKMQQADGFIVDPMIAPTLRSGETGAIKFFLKENFF